MMRAMRIVCLIVAVSGLWLVGTRWTPLSGAAVRWGQDDAAKRALIDQFKANRTTNHQVAYDAATEFLRKYPDDKSDDAQMIRRWVTAYEKVAPTRRVETPSPAPPPVSTPPEPVNTVNLVSVKPKDSFRDISGILDRVPANTTAPPPVKTPSTPADGLIAIESTFVSIPAGQFTMGSNNGDENERPPHQVTISRPFELMKYEVTQGMWVKLMGNNSYFRRSLNLPVGQVSWNDVQYFIQALNRLNDGYVYRLPTEAEWEYACRAGTNSDFFGDEMCWGKFNSDNETHLVGQRQPNSWGLYDMTGNVEEWVQDWYDKKYYSGSPAIDPRGPSAGSRRVIRGGSWSFTSCSPALRVYGAPGYRGDYDNIGFRLVRTLR